MNLTTDAWIPIVWTNGLPGTVSLREEFERGTEIRDLALRPHERIAVMRLLICIAQAGLDGPTDYDDWKACGSRIAPSALNYLDRWQQAFELFGDGTRFLQLNGLKRRAKKKSAEDDEEGNSASKLDLALATGINPTLFDNAGGSGRSFTPAGLALMLTTFQSFSPGGRIGVASWSGQETPGKGSSTHAPCLAGNTLHALLRGDNLIATLHRNIITKEQAQQLYGPYSWGKPVWELMPEKLGDEEAVRNATRTYLGRLATLSRAIRLADDGCSLILANGLKYGSYAEDGWREPSATVVTRTVTDQPTRIVLPASVERAAWRELHALTVKRIGKQGVAGPFALQNLSDEEAFDLWVGGLVANKAKPVDNIESVFYVPAAMLHDTGQRLYEAGVKYAEGIELRLRRAVSAYHRELGDKLDRPEMRNRRLQIQNNATTGFWTDIEIAVPRLLGAAAAPESLGLDLKWNKTAWGKSVWRAACAAYDRACPHETPRQIRAHALGLNALFATPTETAGIKSEEEVEA